MSPEPVENLELRAIELRRDAGDDVAQACIGLGDIDTGGLVPVRDSVRSRHVGCPDQVRPGLYPGDAFISPRRPVR